MVKRAVVRPGSRCQSTNDVPGRGPANPHPQVTATAGRGLANNVGDRKTSENLGKRLAVVQCALCGIVAVLGVEVEAQQAELSVCIGQADTPRCGRCRRAQPVQARVSVRMKLAIGFTDHHANLVTWANAPRQLPRRL